MPEALFWAVPSCCPLDLSEFSEKTFIRPPCVFLIFSKIFLKKAAAVCLEKGARSLKIATFLSDDGNITGHRCDFGDDVS